jgi:photosystem II stability/assembly factor-like uncharacterized protein
MPTGDHVHSIALTNQGEFLLGLHGGLYRSADGKEWEPAGLNGEDAMVIAASSSPVFVAGHEVLYRSDDDGSTFTPLAPSDLPGLDIHGFAQSPIDPEEVYAYVVGRGLYFSDDAGESWQARSSMDSLPRDVFGVAVAGGASEVVVMVGPETGIHRSDDGGQSFRNVLDTPAGALAVDPDTPEVVWALTASGLERSSDTGLSWELISRLAGVDGQPVALTVSSDHVWLVTEQPRLLYESENGGDNWRRVAGS